jgi:hypothetical protein
MGEIFLEIHTIDKALRITAVDAQTGMEVVFSAPAYMARERINELALAKLSYRIRLERERLQANAPQQASERGKLV